MPIRRYLHINPDIVLLQYIDRIYVKKITITTVLAWNLFKSYFWRYLHINPDIMLQKYIVRSYLKETCFLYRTVRRFTKYCETACPKNKIAP